jgi:CD36 family
LIFRFVALTNNFKTPRLFPVLWVDEGLELNDEMTDLVKGDLINVIRLIDILQWTFVGIGAALIVGMLVWYIIARKKLNKTTSTETFAKGEERQQAQSVTVIN